MLKPKVFAHASYIGTTGYNFHTRDFFRRLTKYVDLRVRNFTIGSEWKGSSEEPHNEESYITDTDKKLLIEQTLWTGDNTRDNFPIYRDYPNEFEHNVNLVLEETNHHYFYDRYIGPKIAYNVWESTLQPEPFFSKLLEYDQIWVPSQWQAECTIAQGADPDKVKVVPEGVDVDTFYPEDPVTKLDYVDGRFKFVVFGRWDYRKSTKEIIETFLKEFKPDELVDLILSVDNPFSGDGLETTENRLKHFGLEDPRIKVKHFPSREDYITYMKNGHVFLSCARSEGWNLPLIEAMACGTPSIYSECSGQLEFAKNRGLPVKVLGEKPASDANYNHFNTVVGNYYEPDFEDLARVMRDAFENYTDHKKRAFYEAKLIHRDFNWDTVAKLGAKTLQDFINNYKEPKDTNTINVSYIDGPRVEILGDVNKEYFVEFIDSRTNKTIHSSSISNNMWTACSKKYYIPWIIKVNGKEVNRLNLEGERVLISLESKSIGDTVAWTPYAVEFAKKHNCKVVLSTFHNDWFKNLPAYENIEWITPGSSTSCKAKYKIGWFKSTDNDWKNFNDHPRQCNTIKLQETATDILDLEFKELNYGLDFPKKERPYKEKYVVIGPNATAGCKEWKHEYWNTLTQLLTQSGYKVISLTQNEYKIPNTINYYNQPINVVANILHHADLFIGLGSGLSWLNWALNKHTVMINGFADKNHEFTSKVTRVMNDNVCFPCWTNPNFVFNAGDWDWCPIWKGTDKQHICQKSITPQQVFNQVKLLLKSKK
jgi:autotransporter strand-loop-strand O-heptosyltransferase